VATASAGERIKEPNRTEQSRRLLPHATYIRGCQIGCHPTLPPGEIWLRQNVYCEKINKICITADWHGKQI